MAVAELEHEQGGQQPRQIQVEQGFRVVDAGSVRLLRKGKNKMNKKNKAHQEVYANFFEAPSRESFRNLIKNNIGEVANLDFKSEWPEGSALARHILAFANSGGGCVITGVSENPDKSLNSTGVINHIDKSKIMSSIRAYIPESLESIIDILDFTFEASEYPKLIGKKFQVMIIEDDPSHLPFISKKDGNGIRASAIYKRRLASSDEANSEELEKIINRRLDTGNSSSSEIDLRDHLNQLKTLYEFIPKRLTLMDIAMGLGGTPNKDYPKEDFEKFISKLIELKKRKIENLM